MKKFISVIPLQKKESLHKVNYNSLDNSSLDSDIETRFPILIAIDKSVKSGEKISVISVVTDYELAEFHNEEFKEELAELSEKNGFEYEITEISTPYDENVEVHLKLFGDLIEQFQAGDILTADITYGTKPTPMILSMALNYANNSLANTDVDKIVYGRFDFSTRKPYIHDVSALFYMNSAIDKISKANVNDPLAAIKAIIEM